MKWQVDIIIGKQQYTEVPLGEFWGWETREVNLTIEATTSRDAAQRALLQLELSKDELLHTLFIHLGKGET